jgi:glutaredoxin
MKPFIALLLALSVSAAFAESAYRWVDKHGKVHYSDEPPPPTETGKVEEKRLGASVIEGGDYSYEVRRAAEDFPVILFTGAGCDPACKNARDLLRRRGIPFSETDIRTPEEAAAYKAATGSDALSLPTLVVGRKTQKGYEADAWNGLLDAAGYPPGSRRR